MKIITLISAAYMLIIFTACSSGNAIGKQYTKCGSKSAKKKHKAIQAIQFK